MTSPSFRQVRRAIYGAKRLAGQRVVICRATNHRVDVPTGQQYSDTARCVIRRAVILPTKSIRSFAYDLSFIAANKNFTYGGLFDIDSKVVLVDRRDIARDFVVDQNAYLVIKDVRLEVKTFIQYEDEEAIVFLLAGLPGATAPTDVVEGVSDSFGITEGVADS